MIKDFEYLAPKTVGKALSLLDKYKDDAKIIAGGQSLLVLMDQKLVSPPYLIDIKGISALDYLKLDKKQGLRIGALTTHRTIEKSPIIQDGFSVLAEMEKTLATIQTRNWGTIGGNLSHADPAGDVAPPLIALKANLKLTGLKGERTVKAENFFTDFFETVMKPGEILSEIQVPIPPPHTGTAYRKFSLMEGDMAIVGVAVSLTLDAAKQTCQDARIVLGAAASVPMRAKKAEKVLVGKKLSDSLIQEAAQVASGEASPTSDIHASADYRTKLINVFVKRVAKQALERAQKA